MSHDSPMTANIYLPALPTLVDEFHTTTEVINLTVTIYLVFQGASPLFWGPLSDNYGRRLMFTACLALLAVSCVGLALIPTSHYWPLFLLPFGVLLDVAAPHERGMFFGVGNVAPMLGPMIGPIIGGGLTDSLGWRPVSLFWFLCILSGIMAVIVFLFLPETLRMIVGNGSIAPPHMLKTPISVVGNSVKKTRQPADAKRQMHNPFRLFLQFDVLVLLLFNGIQFAVFYGVTASLSTIFEDHYPYLDDTTTGLCFLAIGGGMVCGTVTMGRIMDRDYRRVKEKMKRRAEEDGSVFDEGAFPFERARIRLVPYITVTYTASAVAYGWCIDKNVNLSAPLIFLFFVGMFSTSMMSSISTLLVDLLPGQGSSITACNNFVRCSLGAVMVSVIQLMFDAIGVGFTFLVLGSLCIVFGVPCFWVVMQMMPVYRRKRREHPL
ncbi:MFS general substrate transporter [Fistulina hepatica ATCC 64428]|uniref:MFS general substrate transporter n=1 Tax=Fistulina hepatica ATCC 64428 TaxID=1128425 RepID=A0A0D7A7C3_9AGAR|nr:MFS general substrate transporter [Fistulina hepatica ATCC 64428]